MRRAWVSPTLSPARRETHQRFGETAASVGIGVKKSARDEAVERLVWLEAVATLAKTTEANERLKKTLTDLRGKHREALAKTQQANEANNASAALLAEKGALASAKFVMLPFRRAAARPHKEDILSTAPEGLRALQ